MWRSSSLVQTWRHPNSCPESLGTSRLGWWGCPWRTSTPTTIRITGWVWRTGTRGRGVSLCEFVLLLCCLIPGWSRREGGKGEREGEEREVILSAAGIEALEKQTQRKKGDLVL